MTKTLFTTLTILLLAGATSFAQTGEKKAMPAKPMMAKSAAAETLMHHEHAMLDAVSKKDWAAFKKYVTPDGVNVDENGATTVAEFLKMVADPKFDLSVEMKTSEMTVMDIDANAKLVSYKLEQKGSMMGQPFPPMVYATTVWVNQGGTWRALLHQESKAAPQQPAK